MRVVIDTNVLVSGLLSPHGKCGEIIRMVSAAKVIPCYDARILSEYMEVLRRPKFPFREEEITSLIDFIEHQTPVVASSPLLKSLPDSEDETFLEVALAGQAECLVTGNQSHFPPKLRQGMIVLSPAEFLNSIGKSV